MEPFTLETLIRAADGAIVSGDGADAPGTRFDGVSTDSRSAREGDLFFALAGPRFDAHAFVPDAFARGVRAAVVRRDALIAGPRERLLVWVDDPLRALGRLAAAYREHLRRAKVIAITGSCGKTTTRDMVARLLEGRLSVVRADKSHNNAVGVPLTIFKADRTTEALVLELGTSRPGEIGALARMARPDVAVVTNVAPAHLEGLGDLDGVAREKGSIAKGLRPGGTLVLNADDERVRAMGADCPVERLLFGLEEKDADLQGALGGEDERTLTVRGRGREVSIRLPFPGRHNARNALAALAAVEAAGVPFALVAPRLESFALPDRRLEPVRAGDLVFIDDAYNANPASVRAALEVLARFPPLPLGEGRGEGRRVFVFGGMAELGAETARLHAALGADVVRARVDLLVAIGASAALTAAAAVDSGLGREAAVVLPSRDAAVPVLRDLIRPGDTVLFKGSRAAELEKLFPAIQSSGCEPSSSKS